MDRGVAILIAFYCIFYLHNTLLNSDNTEFGTMKYCPSFEDEWGETVPGCLALDFKDIDMSTSNRDDGEGDLKTWNVKFSATVKAKTEDISKDGNISIYPIRGIRSDNCNSTLNVTVKNQEESGDYGVHEIGEFLLKRRKVEEKDTGKIVADFSVCMNHDKSSPGTKDGPTWGYKKISNVGEEEYKTYRTAEGNGNFMAVKRLMYYFLNNCNDIHDICYSVLQNEYYYQETQQKLYDVNYDFEDFNTKKQKLRTAAEDSSKDDDIEKRLTLTIFYSATNKKMQNVITGELKPVQEPEKTSVQVEKVWEDNNNQDGKRPNSVKIKLYADGKEVSGKTLTLTQTDNWTGTFEDLDEYKDGKKIKYTVKEEKVENGYTSIISGNASEGYKVTNTRETEKLDVEGKKTWKDKNNQDGKRPESITINLLKNGTKIKSKTVKATDDWKWRFEGLDKYENGQEITYSISEETVEGYSTKIDGYNITNSYTPGKTSVQVTKAWEDNNNQDGKRPNSVKIKLYADDKEVSGKTLTLTQTGNWTGTFEDLDEYKDGKKIKYTVKEEKVENGYTSIVSGNASEGFVVTNIKKVTVIPKKNATPNNAVPKTGDNSNIFIYVIILLLSLSLVGYLGFKYRKK